MRPIQIPPFGADPTVDAVRLADLLRRAHRVAVKRGRVPRMLRPVVSGSWSRATAAGVDSDGSAPKMLDERQTAAALRSHPVATNLPSVRALLESSFDAGFFAALSDANGVLLWADGDPAAIEAAGTAGFLPGHLCSEEAVGTNAVGTSIALDGPVQIFAAEHYSRRLHWLACAAAPIREPETGRLVGVIDVSGDFRHGHPHSLGLVQAVARVLEDGLERESRKRDDRLRAAYLDWLATNRADRSALVTASGRVLAASPRGWLGSRLRIRGDGALALPRGVVVDDHRVDGADAALIVRAATDRRGSEHADPRRLAVEVRNQRAVVSSGEWSVVLTRRQSQVVIGLALHPRGLATEELGLLVYGEAWKPGTLRAEISRLRTILGPVIAADPYRFACPVEADRSALLASSPG